MCETFALQGVITEQQTVCVHVVYTKEKLTRQCSLGKGGFPHFFITFQPSETMWLLVKLGMLSVFLVDFNQRIFNALVNICLVMFYLPSRLCY